MTSLRAFAFAIERGDSAKVELLISTAAVDDINARLPHRTSKPALVLASTIEKRLSNFFCDRARVSTVPASTDGPPVMRPLRMATPTCSPCCSLNVQGKTRASRQPPYSPPLKAPTQPRSRSFPHPQWRRPCDSLLILREQNAKRGGIDWLQLACACACVLLSTIAKASPQARALSPRPRPPLRSACASYGKIRRCAVRQRDVCYARRR
jgi:hypothetical protein